MSWLKTDLYRALVLTILAGLAAVTVAMRLAHTLVEIVLCGVGLMSLRSLDSLSPATVPLSSGADAGSP